MTGYYQRLHDAWNYDTHCPRATRRWWHWIVLVYLFWGLPYGGPLAPLRAMATVVITAKVLQAGLEWSLGVP